MSDLTEVVVGHGEGGLFGKPGNGGGRAFPLRGGGGGLFACWAGEEPVISVWAAADEAFSVGASAAGSATPSVAA